ncbi:MULTISPECIES: hypothetical protein [unclassified Crossiella]|uniref:hypothetical protein n=1 Tax=unclassified Crossiella TaxID=2620835 RepID=UPI001FFF221C|nr:MULTISPECIES: hypothetical protein [unclassified Crossiella]MCK2243654.1 hypothetical protein [Crossiella sp. S99.2]MCK2257512.1 hypothetical protein [Crossiella sp. S99.1]
MKEWFPFTASRSQRVDVFGGTPEGWSSLLATLGTSLLAQGQALTVLDFTETHIALPLARFTRTVGLPVHAIGLPRTLADSGLLQGLQGAEIATLVAEALSVLNPTPLSHTEITTYSDLLIAVTESLERGYTFRRLAAGLQVLSSIARPADEDFPLSREETRAILSRLGTVGASPAANDALRHLRRLIADLAVHETPPPDNDATAAREPLRLCPAQGLVVTYTTGGDSTSKAFLDALVLRRLQHHLSSQQRTPGQDVVFLAGADRFSAPVLDSLTRAARRAEVRLILLFEQLHEQHQHLLGNRDSATVLMRLGNAKEATMAADNIGREHRFTLTQVSTSTGTTYTHGTSINHGAQKSTSTTDSTGDSSNRQAWRWTDDSHSRNSSQTEGASESTSWGSSVSESTAEAETTGTTETRTYEHTVEPSTLQNLPPTAFIVIAPGPGGRLVQAGDCDPGIALRPTTHIARPAVRRGEHGPA